LTKTILIVENDELNLKLFNDILQVNFYKTVQTLDEREAIDLAREHHPDLIIMDIQSRGISGLEVTSMLKADEDLRDIPIIAVSALAMKNDERNILNGGCDGYISKPISIPQFLKSINSYLSKNYQSPTS
jgi:two-component system, cell cycle response regulator DivK